MDNRMELLLFLGGVMLFVMVFMPVLTGGFQLYNYLTAKHINSTSYMLNDSTVIDQWNYTMGNETLHCLSSQTWVICK